MSVLKIRSLASAIITEASSKKIIASAQDGGKIDADERAELDALAAAPADRFESPAARQSFLASYSAATGAPLPPTPRVFTQESRPSWTTTYFPMADYSGDKKGSPESNLWAEHGAADEFDKVLSARHLTPGAREFELQPAINWIVGKPSGGYLANGTVDEKNAEVTTGLDLNGDGKITRST